MLLNPARFCASTARPLRAEFTRMSRLLDFIHRHEPQGEMLAHIKSGTGALVGMTIVGALAALTGLPMLLAPFGATAVLLFGQPESPLAQPANVFGGYLIAAIVSALMLGLLTPTWWVATVAVGIVIALMLAFRVTHPPAGAIPLVALSTGMHPEMLFLVILAGALCLVAVAVIHHWLPPRRVYPRRRAIAPAAAPTPTSEVGEA
jgi:CBS-domain-containing membrane protein